MATPTDIVNIALRRCGANRISNLASDASKEGVVARDLYDEARRDLLASHNWNFAVRRASLTVLATEPSFGWDYAYTLPEQFIRLISVHPDDDDDSIIPYKLESMDSEDRVLLCNATTVYIRYIFDEQDPVAMSSGFRDTLAWRLARDFAAALSKSTASAELAEKMHRMTLSRAKSIEGIEDYPERMAEGDWVTARQPNKVIIT